MNENEMNHRRAGFMIAIGLLAKHADPTVWEGILDTLRSFGQDLHSEIASDENMGTEEELAVSPCPPGFYWDPQTHGCMPKSPETDP